MGALEAVGFTMGYPELSGIVLALTSACWVIAALAEGQPDHWYYAGACALGSALCWMFRRLL